VLPVPLAAILNGKPTPPLHIEPPIGCVVIVIGVFTTKVAVLEVTVLHVPNTVTVYDPAFEV